MKARTLLASILLGSSLVVPIAAYGADGAEFPVFDFSFSNEAEMTEQDSAQIELLAEVAAPEDGAVVVDEVSQWQVLGLEGSMAALKGDILAKADIVEAYVTDGVQTPTVVTAEADGSTPAGSTQTASTTVTAFVYRSDPARNGLHTRTLDVNGTLVDYIDVSRSNAVPDTGAGIWRGSDSTTDGSWGYFVGHHPGSFDCVYNLAVGDTVAVWDSAGAGRTYTVTQAFDIPSTTLWEELQPGVSGYGESVVMQTCNGDDYYRIVIAQ